MRVLILIFLMSASALAHTSYIAKYEITPGFVIHPVIQTVYLQRNHTVLVEVVDPNTHHLVRSYSLGTLSRRAFANASKHIAEVNEASPLVDQDPNAPFCADVPETSVIVIKGDHEVQTSKYQQCHEFALQDGSADSINLIMKGLGELRDP